MTYIADIISKTGLKGWLLDLTTSAVYVLLLELSVLIIGWVVNKIEQFQLRMLSNTTSNKIACFICNRVTFIGTVIHELSHALFVILTGAKLIKVKIFEISKDGTLGHVEFALQGKKWKQFFQLSLISCAPVFMGILIEYLLIKIVLTYSLGLWIEILLWYVIISVFDHMSMSNVDIKNYLHGMIVVYPVLTVLIMFVYYFFLKQA